MEGTKNKKKVKFEEKEEEWSDDNDDKYKIHKPKSDMEKRRKLLF